MTEDSTQDIPKDRPFNPFRIPKTDKLKPLLDDILNQVQNYESHFGLRKRKRRPADQETFEATVTAIVCDLIHLHLTQPEGWVAIPQSKQVLGMKSRYGSRVMNKTLPAVLERLSAPEMSFVDMKKGYQAFTETFGPGRQTTIKAGVKLLTRIDSFEVRLEDITRSRSEEVIILKRRKEDYWDSGQRMDYKDTDDTNQYRQEIKAINDWLEAAELEFDEYYEDDVDTADRRLQRYFCNGSFEQGGRLFGGFWQPLSKLQRKQGILINGERVVSLDYGQMAPRILYGLAGLTPKHEDAYLIPGFEDKRPGMKKVFNAMLFAEKPLARMPKGTREFFPKRITIQHISDMINEYHSMVADRFYTGIGYRIQFIESEILIDVLLALMDKDVVGLPVHDALLVPESMEQRVREVMMDTFRSHAGVDAIVERE